MHFCHLVPANASRFSSTKDLTLEELEGGDEGKCVGRGAELPCSASASLPKSAPGSSQDPVLWGFHEGFITEAGLIQVLALLDWIQSPALLSSPGVSWWTFSPTSGIS